ncbi:cupredoxin domain-containing protein [Candidatus Protofrankia datiscae]|uniref:Blue (Type 1) copper domain protein n=2 Tax=Protofrankia TaxID=2994361 RepID=F8AYK1_9ACTN|nr:cupredoxin domain-containing protein [Candidatus Protofrankia datiscae]AEH11569.1 blue (type 1) copper domain protein [Candidatus Protofrankia datiscae]
MSVMTGPGTLPGLAPSADRPCRRRTARPATPTATLTLSLALVLLVLGLGLSGCGSDTPASSPSATATATPKIENDVQVFDVVGTASLEFSPSTLTARPGKIRVNLTVPAGSAPHNFVIPEIPEARTSVASAGTSQSVTFTIDKPGSYSFLCTIHPNMHGTLTVS